MIEIPQKNLEPKSHMPTKTKTPVATLLYPYFKGFETKMLLCLLGLSNKRE